MKTTHITQPLWALALTVAMAACSPTVETASTIGKRNSFNQLFDIAYTPQPGTRCTGWFTDAGSWMGFTLPADSNWINGFCGPFSLDMNRRQWMAQSALTVTYANHPEAIFTPDSTDYIPGELFLSAQSQAGSISQQMNFINASTALVQICSSNAQKLAFEGVAWGEEVIVTVDRQGVVARHPSGEAVAITFAPDVQLLQTPNNYQAVTAGEEHETVVAISFITSEKELLAVRQKAANALQNYPEELQLNHDRWEGYLAKTLRNDLAHEYDRIAVKAVTTLISNWRVQRGGLLHDGIVPSHAVGYFVGFWAWDSWRFSAAMAKFEPELAKNTIRAMFDYQQPDGMVIDCIYTDPRENNARDSKPPLISWAVDEIFKHNNDTAFVKEIYPQLVSYYNWWFKKRDHNQNGMCEYGSTDGTAEAAAWESGMDNAIRFDEAKMLKNGDKSDETMADAWSFDQESVDLNGYIALEHRLLTKFATLIGTTFEGPDYSSKVADYFFDTENNFFFDRRLSDGSFVTDFGCEAYTPLWTEIARPEQVAKMLPTLQDPARFSTYIPFPTVDASNPKYNPKGYWRGPIWLDQTYFAIRGLRNYGYSELADSYTLQVFDRLQGLKTDAPIHENYGTHTGELLKAPHFSWSASHLLMLYSELGGR